MRTAFLNCQLLYALSFCSKLLKLKDKKKLLGSGLLLKVATVNKLHTYSLLKNYFEVSFDHVRGCHCSILIYLILNE